MQFALEQESPTPGLRPDGNQAVQVAGEHGKLHLHKWCEHTQNHPLFPPPPGVSQKGWGQLP